MGARIWLAFLSFMMASSACLAGPFGLDQGGEDSTFKIQKKINESLYVVDVPKPHPDFDGYVVMTTKKTGICQINATTKTNKNDRFGIESKAVFNKISEQLISIYGLGKLNDFIRSGGIWKGSHEWVMSINQNERVYQQVWNAERDATLKDNIKEIILAVNAGSSDSSWVVLQYRFKNYEECQKEINNQGKSSL